MNTYDLSFDPARLDRAAIHAFLAQSYWSPGIPRAVVEKAIEHSLCIGLFYQGEQVGFARAVTDRATFAYLADVFVLEAHRGRGQAKRMIDALLGHPDLQGLRRVMLATRDAHALYAPFGFRPLAKPERLMEKHLPDVYSQRA